MNKKFFAALASAALLLGGTGLPIFAQEFAEVESGGVPGAGPQDTDASILTAANFPDKALLDYVKTLLPENATGTAKEVAAITGDFIVPAAAQNLYGLQYLTGITGFYMGATPKSITPSSQQVMEDGGTEEGTTPPVTPAPAAPGAVSFSADSVDLSKNTNLKTVVITANDSGDAETLQSVVLPATDTLTNVEITGNKGLTYLDLTGLTALSNLDLHNNSLADLDLSKNIYLSDTLNVNDNSLNKLDTSNSPLLKTIQAANNGLAALTPNTNINAIEVTNNKLEKLDLSAYKQLNTLDASYNMLSSLILPEGIYTALNVSNNHLATLDLSEVTLPSDDNNVKVGNQTVYSNPTNEAVNMKDYDSNFNDTATPGAGIASIAKDGVITFGTAAEPTVLQKVEKATYNWTATDKNKKAVTMDVSIKAANLMNRLYNPNSGEHFYTKDLNERDTLVKLGWKAEGIGWVAPYDGSADAGVPVFRLYNENAGDHHYTTDANERDTLISVGWKNEGIGWYSAKKAPAAPTPADTIEVFREYNPNAKAAGAHNYTISENENDTLVSIGWLDEGIAWWALK